MSYTAAVITVSDKGFKGERIDTSGPAICDMLKTAGYDVKYTKIVPDESEMIKSELIKCADVMNISLILTTGGTGFSPKDITPEATLAVIDRETVGIPEAMRAESMRITPRGCLSRSVAGIRGRTLIVNLPGSEKAAKENLNAVMPAIDHGLQMLSSNGSAECAVTASRKKTPPSVDLWIKEAKSDIDSAKIGMYLIHNGVVRQTPRAQVRDNDTSLNYVKGMNFSYDEEKVAAAVQETYKMKGIYYIRTWLNSGKLDIGDDIMFVMVGGDIRPNVIDALQFLVGKIKSECVSESELIEEYISAG